MALISVRLPLKWDNRIDAKKNPAGDLDCVGILQAAGGALCPT